MRRIAARAGEWGVPVVLVMLLAACAAPQRPEPVWLSNTVRWTTASESDNFGFDVYRSESAEGPWARVTEQPVAGAGTSDLIREYRWVDPSVMPETEYFYFVESISLSGERRRFTPVLRAAPKSAGAAPES